MAECPPRGRVGRGVRCQFRPGFLKGLYPVCGDIMDVGSSAQAGISSSCDFVSPSKGTRTRTVREYEQTINELKKENFDLKLRVFLFEESMSKISRKDKDCPSSDNTVQVIVQLKLETESLQNELSHKNKLLQESTDEVEKLHLEMKELEEKYANLQRELVSLSELPSKEKYMCLLHEKENLLQMNESLERSLLETNENFQEAQQRIEILAHQNCLLEDKIRKRSLAIRGFVHKTYQEREMLPDELRATVLQATQAARRGNEEELTLAVKNFKAALCQIITLEQGRDSSQTIQCLSEESLKRRVLSTLEEQSPTDLSSIQSLKGVISERNSLQAFTQDSISRGKVACSTSMTKVDVLTCRDFSALAEEIPMSLANSSERQHGSVRASSGNVENISSAFSPASVHQSDNLSIEDNLSIGTHSLYCEQFLKEDAEMKGNVEENAAMRDLSTVCNENLPSSTDVALCSANEFRFQRLKETEKLTKKNTQIRDLKAVYAEGMPSLENIISVHDDEFHFPLKEYEILSKKMSENAIMIKDLRTVYDKKMPYVENVISIHANEFDYQTRLKENAELKEKLSENVDIRDLRTVCEEKIPSVEKIISTHTDEFHYQTVLKENEELKDKIGKNVIIQDLRTVCEEKMPSVESAVLSKTNEFQHQKHLKETEDLRDETEDNIVIIKESTEKISFVENDSSSCVEEFQLKKCLKEEAQLKEKVEENVFIQDLRTVCNQEMSSVENSHSEKFQLQQQQLLKENRELKKEAEEKVAVIRDLRVTLEEHKALVQKDAPKASPCFDALVQTEISCCTLPNLHNVSKLDDGVDLLLLEERGRECLDKKLGLSTVRPEGNLNEEEEKRSELYERLAFSCSVNVELVRHLRTLEAFMEELLQNQLQDSSCLETSSFLSGLSKCLNESLKLSSALSDHLSICEESKLFEECKGASFSHLKSFRPIDVSELNLPEHSFTRSQQGTEMREACLSHLNKDIRKEQFPQDSLCRQCWQQMNSIPEFSHPLIVTPKRVGCPSSDSDIWSEPDREVSLQRIGISLQNSPLPSKSPRKLRSKERRAAGRLSTDRNTSSSEMRSWPRSRRNGCQRLFAKDSFALEKYYFLVAEKFSKLQSLRNAFENVEEGDEVYAGMDSVLASLDKTLHKLEVARDHPPTTCGRCTLHELLLDLEDLTNSMPCNSKSTILLQFVQETRLLREECEEPFSSYSTRLRGSMQSDPLSRNEQNKISHLEQVVVDLNEENGKLNQNLDEVQNLLNKEKKKLESLRAENIKLFSEVNDLKNEILNLQQKEEEVSLQNTEQTEKLACLGRDHCELNDVLKVLQNQKSASDAQLDQLIAELQKNKSELVNMSKRCLELEKELSEQTRLKEESVARCRDLQTTAFSEKEKYLTDMEDLRSERNDYVEELEILKKKLLSLEKESSLLNDKLNAKDDKLCSLVETVQTLQSAKETLNTTCTELQAALGSAKERCQYLELKCHSQEEEASKRQATCEEYRSQLQQLQTRFLSEKEKLIEQISLLTLKKDDVLQKLNCEKEHSETLMVETLKLNQKLVESGQQLTSLRLSNERLESSQSSLLQKTQHIQNTLITSGSEREALGNNLKHAHETLVSLESRCSAYEKEIVASAGMKDNVVECLLKIKNELSNTRNKVSEMCKANDGDERTTMEWDAPEFVPMIDEDNVTRLCNLVTSEGQMLFNAIDVLLEILKRCQMKLQKMDSDEDTCDIKIMSIRREVELQKHEVAHLKAQNKHLERILEENKQIVSEHAKSIKISASENHSMREKLQISENETERAKLLLKMKEDEITMLQERIFNLQTYVNSMLVEKVGMRDDLIKAPNERESLPPLLTVPSTLENELNLSSDSLPANSSSPGKRSSCCEKCHSLQKKLVICKRRIEMLEEEKKNLREFHNSRGLLDSTNATLSELESKLEQKKSFISELKGELLKVCNSLIDKEREVDDLKMKLSKYETKSQDILEDLSKAIPKGFDVKRKNLKNYKWKLMQSIYDLQRRFCEQKGIHLKYFEKFKNQDNNFYSLQLGQPLLKSVSLPLLGSHPLTPGWDLDWKGLKLDIECLENFKIFLSHFFIPSVVQVPKSSSKMLSTSSEQYEKLSEKWILEEANLLKPKQKAFLEPFGSDALFVPSTPLDHVKKYSSFEAVASAISHHLDFMENFFNAVKEYELSSSVDDSFKECEADARSLLLRVLNEIRSLHKGARVLLSLNGRIKESGLLRPDVSDGEESDETMAVSRSETPLYEEGRLSRDMQIASKPRVVNHSSCESIHHRSQYSSPDLGIESDPNHEQREDKVMQISLNSHEISGTLLMGGDSLYAIGTLPHYELLRREIQESLVGMRSVLSRTGDGLHHIAARHTTTSPRKTLEYSTLRAIKDTCNNVEACLQEAYRMVKKFQVAPCPSEQEWNALLQENQRLLEQLSKCKVLMLNQESEYKQAMGKLEHAQNLKASMEKKISKKLVKTKKVIRQAELKLLENGCQNCSLLPKCPSDSLLQRT